jgi:hypothetical protein
MLAAVAAAFLLLAAPLAHANGRVALLVGNVQYPSSPLRNSINDVRDLGAALRELGFKTIVKENVTRAEMFAAIQEYGKAIEGADAALFFYAGHAMQFKDRNYLIPIDAVMGSEDDVTFFSIDVSQVFDRMERAKTRFNFVILDACRDNPFRDTFRVSASGLAQMSGPSGSLIAYATAPGATAQDGYNRNGTYTSHILQNIKIPDMPVEVLFRKVREGVERETKRTQTPWELSSIKGEFTFNPSGRGTTGTATASGGPSADTSAQMELLFWKSVQESTRPDDLQAYLDKYPNGTFAALARNRIDSMTGRTRPPPASTVAAASPSPSVAASAPPPASANTQLPAATSPASPQPASPAPESVAAASPGQSPTARTSPAAEQPREPAARPADAPARVAAAPATAPPATRPPAAAAEPAVPAGPGTSPVLPPPRAKDEQPGREIAPGVREVTFNDGSVYRGAMRGIQLHGKGEYTSKSFKYQGEYKDGMMHGQGTYQWENGDRYEGEFVTDRPNGKGRYQFGNGDTYEGEVKAGVVSGRGTYVTKAGDRIEGSFVDGKPNGVGIYRFTSGDRYEGEMVAGKLQGKGRYYIKSGDRIEGTFENGRAQGKGAYYFANGDRYEGDLKDGILAGNGSYFYSNGSKYEGEFDAGVLKGKGAFWFPDGSRFEGVFESGMSKARGESVSRDGKRVPAELVDGLVRNLGG